MDKRREIAIQVADSGADEAIDLPPEFCHYRDEGCEVGKSCLECPLAMCVFEESHGKQHWLNRKRDVQIARLFTTEDKKIRELASMFGVSQRTVQRALNKFRQ